MNVLAPMVTLKRLLRRRATTGTPMLAAFYVGKPSWLVGDDCGLGRASPSGSAPTPCDCGACPCFRRRGLMQGSCPTPADEVI
jgi:hypothetical protein